MIRVESVEYSYSKSEFPLISNLSLHIKTGSVCGILGANGAGKSTLLKMFGGFIAPSAGNCRVLGFKPSDRLPAYLSKMFFLAEETVAPSLLPRDYVRRVAPFYPEFDLDLFEELADKFNLPTNKNFDELSLGQKKKYFLSFGISTNARLLILDEPTNGLDIPSKKDFQEVLRKHQSLDRSFVISTHQASDIEGLVDNLIIIDEGDIVLCESLASISKVLAYTMEEYLPNGALFYEQVGNSFATLRVNESDKRNHIDLRLLYRFVTENTQKAADIFPLENRK